MAVLAAAVAVPACAQAVETVTVTARPPDPVGNSAFSVVSLEAAQLRTSSQLDTALEQVPGLSLFRRNSSLSANPSTQGVSLRSIAPSAAGRALVMLDGVPQNDPFGGWVIWSALPPEDIAGAEVVRGAGAGPYGAGALTGVISLEESTETGVVADASGGSLGVRRGAIAGGTELGKVALFGSASEEADDGWIAVSPLQRGPADDAVTLDARNASLRAQYQPSAGTLISARLGAYEETRRSGLVGSTSTADGFTASLTAAHPQRGGLGWRLQLWLHQSGFSQLSTTIAPARAFTTPSDDQYATPALGWGGSGALRGSAPWFDWELGGDIRLAGGNSKEHVVYLSGAFTQGRSSGGDSLVGGAYAEAARHTGGWLVTLGLRTDLWSSTNGHLVQTDLATGVVVLNQHSPARSGVLPTVRAGMRRDFGGFYVRSAAYEGFRAPSLNELYRPFRLGNNVTEANPGLAPEKLYGLEIGAGGMHGPFAWNLTAFWNQLHGAITNVTVGRGPGSYPGAGFVPAGGLLIQRQNVGDINAPGIEGDLHYTIQRVTLRAAFDLLDQRVHGGRPAPRLTGKRPAQAPRASVTGGLEALLPGKLTFTANVRFESARYADDANTLRLAPATTVSARLSWAATDDLAFFLAADNLFNARVATTESADGVVNYDAPRLLMAGLSLR